MHAGKKDRISVAKLSSSTYCGCVITKPVVSPFIAAARKIGCVTATGTDMNQRHQNIMVDFLLGE